MQINMLFSGFIVTLIATRLKLLLQILQYFLQFIKIHRFCNMAFIPASRQRCTSQQQIPQTESQHKNDCLFQAYCLPGYFHPLHLSGFLWLPCQAPYPVFPLFASLYKWKIAETVWFNPSKVSSRENCSSVFCCNSSFSQTSSVRKSPSSRLSSG